MKSKSILFLCLLCAACYDQAPLATFPPPVASQVRAVLTDSGTVIMGNALGPGVVAVEGIIERADRETWQMRMLHADQRDGRTIDWNRELVSFPSGVMTQPTVRTFQKKKSWVAAVGITVGVFIAARGFSKFGTDDDGEIEPPPPANIRINVGGR